MATRLELPNNQWIEVKDKLRVRDKRDVHTYSVDGVSSDGKTYRFNVVKHQVATAAVRITNWVLKDDRDKVIPYAVGKSFDERVGVIEGLDEDQFDEMYKVLSEHFEPVVAVDESVTEKNSESGGGPS